MPKPRSIDQLPKSVPVLPLSGAILLPRTHRPLNIFEPRYVALIDHILATDRLVGLVQPQDSSEESPKTLVPLQRIGALGRLTHFEETADDRYLVVLEGITRFALGVEVQTPEPYRTFEIDTRPFYADFDPRHGEAGVDRPRFVEMIRNYAAFADLDLNWEEIERTGTADLVNLCCMMSPYGAAEKQVLLEAETLAGRAETLIAMAEIEMARSGSDNALQ